jgi:hypothetical protein
MKAISRQDPLLLNSTNKKFIESHLIGFKAEKSQLTGEWNLTQIRKIKHKKQ